MPWIPAGGHGIAPIPVLRGAKSSLGMGRELLSGLSDRETREVIGALGQKANSLCWAPEEGWAVSGFGTAKSPGLGLCTFIIS